VLNDSFERITVERRDIPRRFNQKDYDTFAFSVREIRLSCSLVSIDRPTIAIEVQYSLRLLPLEVQLYLDQYWSEDYVRVRHGTGIRWPSTAGRSPPSGQNLLNNAKGDDCRLLSGPFRE